jgi:hypothetical protein
MPTFDFTSPDGKSYSVQGPEGATPEQAFQMLQQHLGSAPPVSMGEDAAKSIGAGLGNAAVSTLGLGGDAREIATKGLDLAGSKLGFDTSGIKSAASAASKVIPGLGLLASAPTSQDIRSTVTDPIVSPDYQPQTALGGVLKTGAEFLPAMADPELAGPGLLKTAGKLFASRVAAPALASEGAGALTQGTAAEPYARAAGALLGGAGAARGINAISEARALKAATPALADVKSEATNAYDAMTSRNVATPIHQSTLDNLADDITQTLNNKGIRPSTAESIHKAVAEIKSPATAGAADVADLVAARQNVKSLLGAPDANKAGAFVALGKIENAIEQNSPGTMAKIREADKNYAAAKATEALDKRLARADLRAAGEHSGMNIGNKIRQQVTNYLLSAEAKYLSPETKADLEKIVKGTASQNLVRHVANLLGGGGGLGMLAGGTAGYEAGGLPGAIAGAAAGRAAKMFNNRAVVKQAERAAEAIRRRSPLGQANPAIMPPKLSVALSALRPALLTRPYFGNIVPNQSGD